MSAINIPDLAFGLLVTTSKGSKQLPALYKDGSSVSWQPDAMEIPFEPSAFQDPEANRVTLCMTPSSAVSETIAAIDAWCVQTITANCSPLLGIALTPEQITERYTSCIKTSDKGYKTLRVKMNKSGRYALQCFNSEKERCSHPDTWRGSTIRPQLVFKGLWLMGKDMGALIECTACIVQEPADNECPL